VNYERKMTTDEEIVLYFAYGSNMSTQRLQERVPRSIPIGIAILKEYNFTCNKSSRDGSGKGNIIEMAGGKTWGVLYQIPISQLAFLDRYEGGYIRIEVLTEFGNRPLRAITYISTNLTDEPPFDWYMKYVIDGAKEHDLPDVYITELQKMPIKVDIRRGT
jgi:cation transport regulator ChaC